MAGGQRNFLFLGGLAATAGGDRILPSSACAEPFRPKARPSRRSIPTGVGFVKIKVRLGENGVLDFYCFEHRLALELDGGVHAQIDQMRKDAAKEDYLRTLGIRLLRIPNAMVLEHPDEFVRTVVGAMGAVAEKARK